MSNNQIIKVSIVGILALTFFAVLFGSFYTIDETERGVLLRNGAFVKVVEPGLAFKTPFIESVETLSIQSYARSYNKVAAYSGDQQTATLNVSVSWRIPVDQADKVYTQYKNEEGLVTRLLDRQVPTQTENVFGQYTALQAVQQRAKFVTELSAAIKSATAGPIIIESVQVENIDFSDSYENSVEARMRAEVEVETQKQLQKKEEVNAQIAVTKAKAEGDSKLAIARSEAEATRVKGEAEADAIKARAAALASNQNLVELTKAERWNGVLPTTVLPNGAVPFIDAR